MHKRSGSLVICTLIAFGAAVSAGATALYEIESLDALIDEIVVMERIEDDDAGEIVYHLKRLGDSIDEAIVRLVEHPDFNSSEALADAIALDAARALTEGRLDHAFDCFLGASRLSPTGAKRDVLRLRAAAAAIELGEDERALELAIGVESATQEESIRERASIIGIRAVSHLYGRTDALERIDRLDPGSPLGLYQWFLLGRDDKLRDRITGEFPGSLIAALIDDTTRVRRLLVPSSFLAPFDEAGDYLESVAEDRSSGPETSGEDDTRTVAGLQLGSYRHEPYAVAHRDRLREDGYEATIMRSSDGDHKVIIEFEAMHSRESAGEMLLELRDAGYEGFVRYSLDR